MPRDQSTTRTAERTSDVQLVAASVLTGFAGAGFILVVQRHLGLTAFSPIAQLWSIWSIAAATLMFAYQQWTIRLGIDHPGRIRFGVAREPAHAADALDPAGRRSSPAVARITLFHTSPPASGRSPPGSSSSARSSSGVTRGLLATAGRHSMLALAIAAENVIRFVLAVGFILIGAQREWFGLALLAGFAVIGLLAVPVGSAPSSTSAARRAPQT